MESSLSYFRVVRQIRCAFVSLVVMGLLIATPAAAYSILHNFAGGDDGASPVAELTFDGVDTFYGTTLQSNDFVPGTVFKIKTDGTGYTILHPFAGYPSDGALPRGGVILDGFGNLYGTASGSGPLGAGIVFKMQIDGTGYQILHSFGGPSDGVNPYCSLVLDAAGNLYGTTIHGGSANLGTVFTVATDGTGYAILHDFAGSPSDGWAPQAGLILDNAGNLYGTTYYGGSSASGTVFTMTTGGTGFALLHNFLGGPDDGFYPNAPLIWDGAGQLYGTTAGGYGRVFTLTTSGTSYAILHSFDGPPADGASPYGGLLLDSFGNLYGTTTYGGLGIGAGVGTIFALTTSGTGYTVLHYFEGQPSDGANPFGALNFDAAGNLYGTTGYGGSSSNRGTLFTWP